METIFFDGFDDEDDYLEQAGGRNRRVEALRRARTKEMVRGEPRGSASVSSVLGWWRSGYLQEAFRAFWVVLRVFWVVPLLPFVSRLVLVPYRPRVGRSILEG